MLKKVKLTTRLVSITESGEDCITREAEAAMLVEENGMMFRYKEEENEGTTTLIVAANLIDLRRRGRLQTRMTFIEGRLIPANYITPHGAIDLSVFTHQQHQEVNEQDGSIRIKYSVLSDGKQVADNDLTVTWETK